MSIQYSKAHLPGSFERAFLAADMSALRMLREEI